ncbi:hypothetical protein HOI83_04130 [Candidatus Uhrbacteria bacterium]|jgi:hypothetical protein|nr:hypothetical protein [Candidatus Uhrbacteria bacterium]
MTKEQEKELDPPEAGQIKMADDGPNKGEHFPDRFPVSEVGDGFLPPRAVPATLGGEEDDSEGSGVAMAVVIDDSPAATGTVEEDGSEPPVRDTDDMLEEFIARGEDYERGEDLDATLHNEVVHDDDDLDEPGVINEAADGGPGWIIVVASLLGVILMGTLYFSMKSMLESDYAELETKYSELQADYQGTDTARLNARISELEEQEARLRGAHTFDGTIISRLDGKVDAAESELEAAKSELEAMSAELAVAREAAEDARADSRVAANTAVPDPEPATRRVSDDTQTSVEAPEDDTEVVYGSYAQRLVRQRQARLAGRLRGR